MLPWYGSLCPGGFKRDTDEDIRNADEDDADGQADALQADAPQANAPVEVRAADDPSAKKSRRKRGRTSFRAKPKGVMQGTYKPVSPTSRKRKPCQPRQPRQPAKIPPEWNEIDCSALPQQKM